MRLMSYEAHDLRGSWLTGLMSYEALVLRGSCITRLLSYANPILFFDLQVFAFHNCKKGQNPDSVVEESWIWVITCTLNWSPLYFLGRYQSLRNTRCSKFFIICFLNLLLLQNGFRISKIKKRAKTNFPWLCRFQEWCKLIWWACSLHKDAALGCT